MHKTCLIEKDVVAFEYLKEMRKYFPWILLLIFPACGDDDLCCVNPNNELIGSWTLFERGYSPGSGYIVDPVSETPAQTMVMASDGRFASNIQQLETYRYFAIIPDQDREILALFKSRPSKDVDIDQLEHSYIVEHQEDGTVKLFFRFCIEGCHLGLRKTN